MLIEIMKILGAVFCFSWFVWPFAFVFTLAHGIKELIESKEKYFYWLLAASASLLMIVSGLFYMLA